MTDSYRKINYSLRPAKSIERKMLVEIIRRLSVFGSLDSYRYIGMGSIYFSDFSLFHKTLGLNDMKSIEKDKPGNENHKKRFDFNKPYGFIDIHYGDSWNVLPELVLNGVRTILWLDYDGIFQEEYFKDVSTFFTKASSGSLFLISFNIQDQLNDDNTTPLDRLESIVGKDRIPKDIDEISQLSGWNRCEIFRRIINNEIQEILKNRNGILPQGGRLKYKQILNFRYNDGAMMMTIGGILYDNGQNSSFEQCNFGNLEFFKPESEAYKIEVPCLTFKEIRFLDSEIPIKDNKSLFIPSKDIDQYKNIYRYFPNFAETDI